MWEIFEIFLEKESEEWDSELTFMDVKMRKEETLFIG